MSRFTKQQWREIEEARERLEAIKLKVQPYPILELPEEKPIAEQRIYQRTYVNIDRAALKDYKRINDLEEQCKGLTSKVIEIGKAMPSKKRSSKF